MASGSEKRRLPRVIALRVTEAEWSAWQRRAEDAGLSVGAYIRSVMDQTPAPPARRRRQPVKNGEALARLLGQVGKVGSNVNQIAHGVNLGNPVPFTRMMAQAQADIRTMRDLLMQALGVRRPAAPDEGG